MVAPYISITDFTSVDEVRKMERVFLKWSGGMPHQLMAGVMMSYKTLHNLPSSWTEVFPKKELVSRIFPPRHETEEEIRNVLLNTIHYADYERKDWDVAKSLHLVVQYGFRNLHAVQLDMTWPSEQAVEMVSRGGTKVVLQVGEKAFRKINQDPVRLVRRLNQYRDKFGSFVDYVLLDKSMGHGQGLDAEFLRPFLRQLAKERPDLGLAVAGGIGPETLGLVEPLLAEFPSLSIDAQGQLRPSGSCRDPINWNMAELYLERALKMFRKYQGRK